MSNPDTNFSITHFLIAGILSILLVFFSLTHHLDWLTIPITSIFSPLRVPFLQINKSTTQLTNQLREIPNQQRLIKDLRRQNANLALLAQNTELLTAENESLRGIIHSPIATSHRLLPVRVSGIARFAYIDHGINDGLKVGQAVVADNILLGVVDSTSANSARVKLLSDSSLTVPATTSLGSTGSVSFEGNNLIIHEVLQKQPLQVDDRVFTAGSEQIPSNLLIGTVTEIKSNQSSVYQAAAIKPAANLADHQILFVVLD